MGFRKGAYAKIWSIEDKGNFTKVNLSVSKKNKTTGEYVTDFSGFVNLVGTAYQESKKLKEGDSVKIGDCEVTTSYNKDTKTNYTNYAIFSLDSGDSTKSQSVSAPSKKSQKVAAEVSDNGEEEDLPF